ncbi:fused PTS fructose transporter subunit IIA/HPr protein [Vibrio olivae]|uniref:Multiphosphoryl transfer protein n=1 Tax=Vibrio olivae TaxID=1243002 RepID=A0ABV5HRB8_9VIBR
MLQLTTQDITLNQSYQSKQDAIRSLASQLANKGLVKEGYVEGMLNREQQNSTFLGSGIAIPHGTTDTRDQVNETGVTVQHFPEGVNWGDGNIAYLAIGIAAKSDEHLGILKQLTKVLSADGVEDKLKQATNAEDIIALLNGDVQFECDFDASLIQLDFPASDMVQMAAVAGGLLKNTGCCEAEYVGDLVTKQPTHVGNGLWVVSSNKSVKRTAMSFVTTANHCEYENLPVKGLVAFAACNNAHQKTLAILNQIIFDGQQAKLLNASVENLIAQFTGEEIATTHSDNAEQSDNNTAVFKIKNAHGLHARPGAMLVAEAKKFDSTIKVSNLDGDGKTVNAKSLMKVIALGVKHGHQLQFTAEGADAEQALAAIGAAIESGLGEA